MAPKKKEREREVCFEEFLITVNGLEYEWNWQLKIVQKILCQGAYSCSRIGCVLVTVAAGAFVSPIEAI